MNLGDADIADSKEAFKDYHPAGAQWLKEGETSKEKSRFIPICS